MATFVVGDIHGCYDALQRLQQAIEFDPGRDRIWLVGDLVNRGRQSAEVVEWAMALGDRVTAVLGNHDLRLLAVSEGACEPGRNDDFGGLLEGPEGGKRIAWMRDRPLLHVSGNLVLVHAGLWPGWALEEAGKLAGQAGERLRGPNRSEFLRRVMDGPLAERPPEDDSEALLVWAVQVLTRIRLCRADGRLCDGFTGHPDQAPAGCSPWFALPSRLPTGTRVFFGHWAMLGLHVRPHAVGLDSGCVYGGQLSAIRLDDGAVFQVSSSVRQSEPDPDLPVT